jgi:hypothetical protein
VVEPKLFLELLLCVLGDSSRLNRSGERLERGVARQVRDLVFLLSGQSPFTDEPDLVTRHALHSVVKHPVLMAFSDTNAASWTVRKTIARIR